MTKSYSSIELKEIYKRNFGKYPDKVQMLPESGSDRKYFRFYHENDSMIGCASFNIRESEAFIVFTSHFFSKGLPVPKLLAIDENESFYFLEDLGDDVFFDHIMLREKNELGNDIVDKYKLVLKQLVRFQVEGHQGLDYSVAYPRDVFDKQSVMWDLYYFKYYFLKIHVDFDEQLLEDNYLKFADMLMTVDNDYFMYRDFQSRNIIFKNNQPYFIDYQGGRKGPLQYDLASILFQAKADLPFELREVLLDYYLENLKQYKTIDTKEFKEYYYLFVLVRTLQVLGAYGFRGLIQKKQHFVDSIPFAWKNLNWLIEKGLIHDELKYLKEVLKEMLEKTFYFQTIDYAESKDK